MTGPVGYWQVDDVSAAVDLVAGGERQGPGRAAGRRRRHADRDGHRRRRQPDRADPEDLIRRLRETSSRFAGPGEGMSRMFALSPRNVGRYAAS